VFNGNLSVLLDGLPSAPPRETVNERDDPINLYPFNRPRRCPAV